MDKFSIDDVMAKVSEYAEDFLARLPQLGLAVVAVVIFFLVARRIKKVVFHGFEKAGRGGSGAAMVSQLAYVGIFLIGILIATTIVIPSFSFGTLIGTLGLGSVAIGFAFKDILENFFAGVYILVARPFKEGDVIQVAGVTGKVMEIGTRATIIQEFDRKVHVMPCSILFKEDVMVISRNHVRRVELSVGIDYASDMKFVKSLVEEGVADVPGVADDPPPLLVFTEFTDSSINFTLYFFSDLNEFDARIVKSDVFVRINDLFAANNIEIPYPHQVEVRKKLED